MNYVFDRAECAFSSGLPLIGMPVVSYSEDAIRVFSMSPSAAVAYKAEIARENCHGARTFFRGVREEEFEFAEVSHGKSAGNGHHRSSSGLVKR